MFTDMISLTISWAFGTSLWEKCGSRGVTTMGCMELLFLEEKRQPFPFSYSLLSAIVTSHTFSHSDTLQDERTIFYTFYLKMRNGKESLPVQGRTQRGQPRLWSHLLPPSAKAPWQNQVLIKTTPCAPCSFTPHWTGLSVPVPSTAPCNYAERLSHCTYWELRRSQPWQLVAWRTRVSAFLSLPGLPEYCGVLYIHEWCYWYSNSRLQVQHCFLSG